MVLKLVENVAKIILFLLSRIVLTAYFIIFILGHDIQTQQRLELGLHSLFGCLGILLARLPDLSFNIAIREVILVLESSYALH